MGDTFASEIWEDIFNKADEDKDGYLSLLELGNAMRLTGKNPTDTELQDMLLDVDENDDGRLDFAEFSSLMSRQTAAPGEVYDMFRKFDKDKNGFIDWYELKDGMKGLIGEEIPDEEIDDMMEEADIDGDGRINYAEFERMMQMNWMTND